MLARECVIETPVPRRWIWPALVDLQTLTRWSGFDRCVGEDVGTLGLETELSCTLNIGDHAVGATLSVIEADAPRLLRLRTEAAIATVFERIDVEDRGRAGSILHYHLDVSSPLLGSSLEPWIADHVGIVNGGLEQFLDGSGECWTVEARRGRESRSPLSGR